MMTGSSPLYKEAPIYITYVRGRFLRYIYIYMLMGFHISQLTTRAHWNHGKHPEQMAHRHVPQSSLGDVCGVYPCPREITASSLVWWFLLAYKKWRNTFWKSENQWCCFVFFSPLHLQAFPRFEILTDSPSCMDLESIEITAFPSYSWLLPVATFLLLETLGAVDWWNATAH